MTVWQLDLISNNIYLNVAITGFNEATITRYDVNEKNRVLSVAAVTVLALTLSSDRGLFDRIVIIE